MCAFSYLNPYLDKIFAPYQRWQRIVVMLTLIYTCFIIFILHHVSASRYKMGGESPIFNSFVIINDVILNNRDQRQAE